MYQKVRFTNGEDSTAGLILDSCKLADMSVNQVSALFPYSEALKMRKLEVSPEYPSFDEAFLHDFDKAQ